MRRLVRGGGADLPLALLALAVFLMQVFQTVQYVRQSQALMALAGNQEGALQEASRLRQAADTLANDIVQLAEQGDANAKQIVDELARQNINLRPPKPAAAPAEK
jgi:uncharacterized protein YoxC